MNPVALSIELLKMAANNDPEFETRPYLNSLAGVDLQSMMKKNVVELPKTEGEAFKKLRLPYLLYD